MELFRLGETHVKVEGNVLRSHRFVRGSLYKLHVDIAYNSLSDFVTKAERIASLSDSDYKQFSELQQSAEGEVKEAEEPALSN